MKMSRKGKFSLSGKNEMESRTFKSHRAIIFYVYLSCLLSFYLYELINGMNFLWASYSCLLLGAIFYVILLRDAHMVIIENNRFLVKNYFGKVQVDLPYNNVKLVDYERSGYCLISFKPDLSIVKKPYDTLYINVNYNGKKVDKEIRLNLRVFEFSKLINFLNNSGEISDN